MTSEYLSIDTIRRLAELAPQVVKVDKTVLGPNKLLAAAGLLAEAALHYAERAEAAEAHRSTFAYALVDQHHGSPSTPAAAAALDWCLAEEGASTTSYGEMKTKVQELKEELDDVDALLKEARARANVRRLALLEQIELWEQMPGGADHDAAEDDEAPEEVPAWLAGIGIRKAREAANLDPNVDDLNARVDAFIAMNLPDPGVSKDDLTRCVLSILDDAICPDPTDGYRCTQELHQLHRHLAQGGVDEYVRAHLETEAAIGSEEFPF